MIKTVISYQEVVNQVGVSVPQPRPKDENNDSVDKIPDAIQIMSVGGWERLSAKIKANEVFRKNTDFKGALPTYFKSKKLEGKVFNVTYLNENAESVVVTLHESQFEKPDAEKVENISQKSTDIPAAKGETNSK